MEVSVLRNDKRIYLDKDVYLEKLDNNPEHKEYEIKPRYFNRTLLENGGFCMNYTKEDDTTISYNFIKGNNVPSLSKEIKILDIEFTEQLGYILTLDI
jgi:hypothetical protein